jgi:hypothetical protein
MPNALERRLNALERRLNPLEHRLNPLGSRLNALGSTPIALERTPKAFSRTPIAFSRARNANSPRILIFKGQRAGCRFYLFTGKLILRMKKRMKKVLSLVFVLILTASFARAQTAEVTIQLNEQFFDALLDAIFKHTTPPEFPLAGGNFQRRDVETQSEEINRDVRIDRDKKDVLVFIPVNPDIPVNSFSKISAASPSLCPETIRLQREIDGVRTAVRLREGRISAPIAFTGTYNPPLIGCIEFSGVADANIDLEFDRERQALVGYIRISSVNLSGAGGIGSTMIAGLVQSSIDKKINPLQILPMDKISFLVPVQGSKGLRMKALGIKNEIGNGVLNVRIQYEFQKAE